MHESNPSFPSLSEPGFFGTQDDEKGFNLSGSKPKPKATGTKARETVERRNGDRSSWIFHKKIDSSDLATKTIDASPATAARNGTVTRCVTRS